MATAMSDVDDTSKKWEWMAFEAVSENDIEKLKKAAAHHADLNSRYVRKIND